MASASRASRRAGSVSKTSAGPRKRIPSRPVILPTAPSGASEPERTVTWPSALIGSSRGRTMVCDGGREGARASATRSDSPEIVIASGSGRRFASSMNFKSAGVPPASCKSSIKCSPQGFMSHNTGVRRRTRSKSSYVSSSSKARAMASKWSTAFVDPPVHMTAAIAFSSEPLVTMSRGFMSCSRACLIAAPTAAHSASFASAGVLADPGSDSPSVSITVAIVFAVNMPPHAPGPGQAHSMTRSCSFAEISPVTSLP
mmetsp:Transcript_21758/g.68158  ORF Transcript_21758/g.68158 Transcript_21758/m.68158 type:complete len:257 (+) Transcript_21758:443-1213(+)